MAGICFYCRSERARTDEHIFGTQFVKVLAEDPNFETPTETHMAQWGGPVLRTTIGKSTRKGAPTIEFVIKVGGDCNSGWMSRVDDRAAPLVSPMIRGHKTTINSEERALVAAWAIKTALSGRYAYEPPQAIEDAWVDVLRTTEQPLPGWRVWIGVFDGNPSYFFNCNDGSVSLYEITDAGVVRQGEASAHSVRASFVIGYLAVQVFGPTGGEAFGIDMNPDAFRAIWPDDGETIEWPPERALRPELVRQWVERLNGGAPPNSEQSAP